MERTNVLIVEQLKAGNEAAYKFLYDNHYQILCHVAELYVRDQFLAETIVSDVIFHLWEIRQTLNIKTSIRGYLVQCVRHRCMDYLKSVKVQHERPTGKLDLSDLPIVKYIQSDDYPLGKLLESELEEKIGDAIEKLPDECRRVFCMSRFDGMSHEEIARQLNISMNTVKYHIKHALALLRTELRQYLAMLFFFFMESMS